MKLLIRIIILFLGSLPITSMAQNELLLHGFKDIPQSSLLNPAIQPACNGYFTPISFQYNIKHTGFTYNDVFKWREDDSLVITEDEMIKALDKFNYLNTGFNLQTMSFGFRANQNYFTFSYQPKVDVTFSYPKDLIILAIKNNSEFRRRGEAGDFSGFGVNLNAYHELALGFSRKINYQWTIGMRAKLLLGYANVYAKKTNIKYNVSNADTSNYAYNITADMEINTSAPFDIYKDTSEGNYYSYDEDYWDSKTEDMIKDGISTENIGFAIDLGATYNVNPKTQVGLSILDLGQIKWKRNAKQFYNAGAVYNFYGFDLSELMNDSTDIDEGLDELLDSLQEIFDVKDKNIGSYVTPLNPKIYLSGTYQLTKNAMVSALYRGEIFTWNERTELQSAFALSYYKSLGTAFTLGLNYSLFKKSYLNLGLGAMFSSGPLQMFILTDNAYASIGYNDIRGYRTSKNMNFRFGMNILIGKNALRNRDEKDMPRRVPSFFYTNRAINSNYKY